MGRFLLPLSEYNRIHQVAHGVTRAFGGSEKGCIFFAACGAMILNKHYKIPARAVAGAFALRVNEGPDVVFFGERRGNQIATSPDGFHMWVQTETHIIDFMAPIFPETFAERQVSVPRKMFQRTIESEAKNPDALDQPGDFYTLPDATLTAELLDGFLGRPAMRDLLQVADHWFGHRRRPQVKSIQMGDSGGEAHNLSLPSTIATGSW